MNLRSLAAAAALTLAALAAPTAVHHLPSDLTDTRPVGCIEGSPAFNYLGRDLGTTGRDAWTAAHCPNGRATR